MKMRRLLALALFTLCVLPATGQSGGELRFCLRAEPRTFDPILVQDDASETIRYLTGGVLLRVNRRTQLPEAELATSWKVEQAGRQITFNLRHGIAFSDGTPFSATDVAFTMKQLMDPSVHSPTGDAFRSAPGEVQTTVASPDKVTIRFPAAVAALDKLFDQVAIKSANSPLKEKAVLGPFMVADYKPGAYVLLNRNPNYWKKDAAGHRLPYLDAVRLEIQRNRDLETLRFERGEIQLINSLDSELFEKLLQERPGSVRDSGPGLDNEFFWFNQVDKAPIPAYKLAWFKSTNFRRAMSYAVNRDDIARLVFANHAAPAAGPVPPANRFWFNAKLKPDPYDPKRALALLARDGFHLENTTLKDRDGNAVEFSLITNAGNRQRERMAALMQQDAAAIGIKINVVTLDFPSLIERFSESFNYEACLLGFINNEIDPYAQMTAWLSSGDSHQWNPRQKSPATAWEAEIDKLMRAQASTFDPKKRKEYYDQVQQIAVEQAPFIYLVNKNALSAVSPELRNVEPVPFRPQTYWNIERIALATTTPAGSK